jgi:uncharacterized protein (DUF1501 family)
VTSSTDERAVTDRCCDDDRHSRRTFLRGAAGVAAAAGGTLFGSTFLQTTLASPAEAAVDGNVLVVLSLRGGADMLSLVVPHGDPAYEAARPTIAIPRGSLLEKDDTFGLHPKLKPLTGLWDSGRMAAVVGVGLPVKNRSHFEAMEEVEDADPGDGMRTGWLNRLVGLEGTRAPTEGVHLGSGMVPTSLYGPEPVLATADVDQIALNGPTGRAAALRGVWAGVGGDLGQGARAALTTNRQLTDVTGRAYRPAHGAHYPDDDLGDALKEAARLVKAGLGVRAVTVDHGSWDMHARLGDLDTTGPESMASMASVLARSVSAFFTDLGATASRVTLVTVTEFGRRVAENGSRGLDHGWGNTMLVLGAGLRRSGYFGTWPGLDVLDDGDLRVTTDYRSVLAEVLRSRFDASVPAVFPGFTPETVDIMR